jgi:hypothetical protein
MPGFHSRGSAGRVLTRRVLQVPAEVAAIYHQRWDYRDHSFDHGHGARTR